MSLLKNALGRKVVEQVTIKNLKLGFGHDLQGCYCDFYLGGKKMGYMNDDGWGGEVEITYVSHEAKAIFEAFLTKNKVAQLYFENGWAFMETADKIDLRTQAECIIDDAVNMVNEVQFAKKIQKRCEKAIVYGTDTATREVSWKGLNLRQLVTHPSGKGVEALQKAYNDVKGRLQPNERIINTNLEALGIKL